MQQKLDDTEEEICSLKKELDAEKALLGENNQKLDEMSSALQQSQAKAAAGSRVESVSHILQTV